MFKQIKKLFIALVLVFSLCLVACGEECPELPDNLIDPSECPEQKECPDCPECPEFNVDEECTEAGWHKGECVEGIVAPTDLEFAPVSLTVEESSKLELTVTPENAFNGVKWSSSDESVIKVAEDGTVTALRPGTATITVKSVLDSSVEFELELAVEESLSDAEIAKREFDRIVSLLNKQIVDSNFELPSPWNSNTVVKYTIDGSEVTEFVAPELGTATSKSVLVTVAVEYGNATGDDYKTDVTVYVVPDADDQFNDAAKINTIVSVATGILYEYAEGGEKVESDLELISSMYGISFGWSTSKAYVLTTAGEYTRPNNDTSVTLKISPSCGAVSTSKSFELVAKGYSVEEKIAYLTNSAEENASTGKPGVLASIANGKFAGNVALPEKDDKFGILLTYVSENQDILANDGTVTAKSNDNTVKLVVTAEYYDANSPENKFEQAFEIELTVYGKTNEGYSLLEQFANNHPQFDHIAYGNKGTETTYIIDTVEAKTLVDNNITISVAEEDKDDVKVNEGGSVEVTSQYLRYHEVDLIVKCNDISYIWTVNIGIGEVQNILYWGGRSNNQTSKNAAEKGDLLNSFSAWDSFVGIPKYMWATEAQFDKGFSGYTLYIDVESSNYEVIFTKDLEGNVTITPTDNKEKVRHQMFFMECTTMHITYETMYADLKGADGKAGTDGIADTEVKLPRLTDETKGAMYQGAYNGNWTKFYVNDTNFDLDIPVSTLSIAGAPTYADKKTSVTTYAGTFTKLAEKNGEEVHTLLNEWGGELQVQRNGSIAFDGYRTGATIKPVSATSPLEEGEKSTYKFEIGLADSKANSGSIYVQSAISGKISDVWGTPYLTLPAGGYAIAFHEQEKKSEADTNGGYILGVDKSVTIHVERYTRHVNNEYISAPLVSDIKSYLTKLVPSGSKLSEVKVSDITFNDISVTELKEIDKLLVRYNNLKDAWKVKEDVVTAKTYLDLIIEAADKAMAYQVARIAIADTALNTIKTALNTHKGDDLETLKTYLNTPTFVADLLNAKTTSDGLTEGQIALYSAEASVYSDMTVAEFKEYNFDDKAWVLKVEEVIENIIDANEKVSSVEKVKELYEAYNKLEENEKTYVNSKAVVKIEALKIAADIWETEAKTEKVTASKNAYTNAGAEKQAIIDKTYAQYAIAADPEASIEAKAGYLVFLEEIEEKIAAAAEAERLANIAKTLELASAIKNDYAKLPTADQFTQGNYTEDDYKLLASLIISSSSAKSKFDQLVELYKTLNHPDAATATTSTAKIAMLVKGFTKVDPNDSSKTVVDSAYGNFSAAGEKDILDRLVDLPSKYNAHKASEVTALIGKVPSDILVTVDDEASIKAAKDALGKLTDDQKALVADYDKNKLTKAEEALTVKKNQAAALPAITAINAIPAFVTLNDAETVAAARKAYNALKSAEQAVIDASYVSKLTAAEATIANAKVEAIKVSETYLAAVKAFGDNKVKAAEEKVNGTITKDSKAATELLVEIYNAMTADEKAYFAKQEGFTEYVNLVKVCEYTLGVYKTYVAE